MMLYKSCAECEQKCCKCGPGPYKTVSVTEYLGNFGTSDNYNRKCENMGKGGKCKLWKTPRFPTECRTYVCTSRRFSVEELELIEKIHDVTDMGEESGYKCIKCESNYVIEVYTSSKRFTYRCEACDHMWAWVKQD